MMPLLRYLLITVIGVGAVLQHGSAGAADVKTFTIAAHEWPPFTSREAKYFGITPRIVSDILQNQGIEVKYRFMPWSAALDGVVTGEVDGAIIWVTEDLNRESFLISDPILEHQTALYYRKSTPAPATLDSLAGYRLGTKTYYVYDLATYRLLQKRAITPVEADTNAEQLRNLLEGKIDFYASPVLTKPPQLHNHLGKEEQNALTYSSNLFKFPSPHLIVHRHREGSAEFMNKFNQRLKRMKSEGTIERYSNDFRFTGY